MHSSLAVDTGSLDFSAVRQVAKALPCFLSERASERATHAALTPFAAAAKRDGRTARADKGATHSLSFTYV